MQKLYNEKGEPVHCGQALFFWVLAVGFWLLVFHAEAIDLQQAVAQEGHHGGTDGEGHLAVVVEGLRQDGGLHFLDDAHHLVHQGVLEDDGDLLIHGFLDDGGSGDGLGSGSLISLDESAGA